MEKAKTILAIGAHPDDIEFGCGGTLIKESDNGSNIYMLVASAGSEGGDATKRLDEQKVAASIINVKGLFLAHFKDTNILFNSELIDYIEDKIKKIKPDKIYVNSKNDSHQDHTNLSLATIAAARYSTRVLFYETYSSLVFNPCIFSDISNVIGKKTKALEAHNSQTNKFRPEKVGLINGIKSIATYRGFQIGVQYAEGFEALKFLL